MAAQHPALSTCWRHDELPAVLSNVCRGQEPSAEGCLYSWSVGSDLGHCLLTSRQPWGSGLKMLPVGRGNGFPSSVRMCLELCRFATSTAELELSVASPAHALIWKGVTAPLTSQTDVYEAQTQWFKSRPRANGCGGPPPPQP